MSAWPGFQGQQSRWGELFWLRSTVKVKWLVIMRALQNCQQWIPWPWKCYKTLKSCFYHIRLQSYPNFSSVMLMWSNIIHAHHDKWFLNNLIIFKLSIFILAWGSLDPRCAKCVGSEGVHRKVNINIQVIISKPHLTVYFVVYTSMFVYCFFLQLGSSSVVDLSPRMFSSLHGSSGQPIRLLFSKTAINLKSSNVHLHKLSSPFLWRTCNIKELFSKNNAQQARHADFWLHSTMYFMGCCWWLWSGLRSSTFQINPARIWWHILHVQSPTSGQLRCSIWRWFLVAVRLFLCQTRSTCFHRHVALENELSFPRVAITGAMVKACSRSSNVHNSASTAWLSSPWSTLSNSIILL